MSRALLVIDVQNEYFTGALPITHPAGHLAVAGEQRPARFVVGGSGAPGLVHRAALIPSASAGLP